MMSPKSKNELLEVLRPRYLKASKVEKQKMLDEITVPLDIIENMQSVYLFNKSWSGRQIGPAQVEFFGSFLDQFGKRQNGLRLGNPVSNIFIETDPEFFTCCGQSHECIPSVLPFLSSWAKAYILFSHPKSRY